LREADHRDGKQRLAGIRGNPSGGVPLGPQGSREARGDSLRGEDILQESAIQRQTTACVKW